jgi:methylase of polypeptide subunit release factors
MANRTLIQTALQKPYDRILFGKEVLSPVFGSCFNLSSSAVPASVQPNQTEQAVIQSVFIYGNIHLEDGTEITCYEINLQPSVRIEQSKVAIQRYVRKLLTAGQIALVNFISPQNTNVWRLTLVAKDSELTEQGIKEKTTHAKRYTYLLGPSESCKTAAERFETLSTERQITFQSLVNAFSVEKLSKAFFDEYTLHYQKFCDYLQESNFRKSVFNISIPPNATNEEKEKACKPIRDFVKKLLGRIVFLYFVQKKGWLGASDTQYKDGLNDFIKQLFKQSGGNDAFYSTWLTKLFFETLNKERNNDDFIMPNGEKVKVPFLNGGLFDKEKYDEATLTIPATLFHHPDLEEIPLTERNRNHARGFLDFLDAFNFTVHEDSPDDHTVAVDPEMLGHIFENLLEDNKDKGAFYTPKEIVHYMCQESLTEYLTTHLSKEYTVYKEIGNAQVELFGNETRTGQLKIMEQLGDKALNRDDVAYIVKHKDISRLTKAQLKKIDALLDKVKICDPAIGSGAFPMGLLQEIHAIKEVIAYELQQPWKPAEVKENIIQNSIYGVDIEKGAVDIARLRFWLSLVVDEEKPRALPNLDYKIVVGDSLVSKFEGEIIEIDWERKNSVGKADTFVQNIQRLLNEIAEKQKKFFKPDNKDKKKLQAEIRNLKLELLINQLSFNKEVYESKNKIVIDSGLGLTAKERSKNLEVEQKVIEFKRVIAKLKELKQNKEAPFEHFDWKLDFPEVLNPYLVNGNAGFDIVIANPPYISWYSKQARVLDNEVEKALRANYKFLHGESDKLRINSAMFFMEKGFSLLKNEAFIIYIQDLNVLENPFKSIRKFVTDNFKLNELITGLKAFENVGSGQVIFSGYRTKAIDSSVRIKETLQKTNSFLLPQEQIVASDYSWIISSQQSLLSQIETNCDLLEILYESHTGVAVNATEEGKAYFIRDKPTSKTYPFLKGGASVYESYCTPIIDSYLLYDKKKEAELNDEFDEWYFKNKGSHQRPFNLRKIEEYNRPKIFLRQSDVKFTATYIEDFVFGNYSLFNIYHSKNNKDELKYLLALLNSKLLSFYGRETEIILVKAGKTPQIRSGQRGPKGIKQLPIKRCIEKKPFLSFVDYTLFLKSQDFVDVNEKLIPTYFEQIIDGIVYELYFPELIKKHKREIIQHLGDLPEFTDNMSDEQKMKICKTVFERLHHPSHPVRINLEKMKEEIPEIRIIEGIEK